MNLKSPLLAGVLLTLAALFALGQSRPPAAPAGQVGRYQLVASHGGGAYVIDTATGEVKPIKQASRGGLPPLMESPSVPFWELPPSSIGLLR